MKRSIIAALLTLAAGSAAANNPFDFQRQIAAEEYVHGYDARHLTFAPVEPSGTIASLTRWTLDANVDGIALNPYQGELIKSGPSRISLYEVQRDSPEGIAYRDYHDRYPVGTDWERVAREFRESQMHKGLASEMHDGDGRS